MKPCTCKHLGQCPFSVTVHPLARTYPDGTRTFRQLTAKEGLTARCSRSVNGQTQKLHDPQLGDQVATDGNGNTDVVARALDPERAVAHAMTFIETDCKAERFIWRKLHPVPKADLVVVAEQCPED